jgi:hypothetical protein
MNQTIDFGAPEKFGLHHFYVEIPPSPRDAISIYEDFGFDGDESKRETKECRVVLARELWTKIRDEARRDFNARLKAKKMSTGSWNTGMVKLDRFLGRELCLSLPKNGRPLDQKNAGGYTPRLPQRLAKQVKPTGGGEKPFIAHYQTVKV